MKHIFVLEYQSTGGEVNKPFNLERALAGDPVVTRDGRKVLWIAHCSPAKREYQVQALVEGIAYPLSLNADGRYNCYDEYRHDLFMAPKKRTVWARFYRHEDGSILSSEWYDTKEMASKMAPEVSESPNYIGVYQIEIEE